MHMYEDKISQAVPVAGAIFKRHDDGLSALEQANRAVYEAALAIVEYRDSLASVLFGVKVERLEQFASAKKFKLDPLLQSGVSVFGLRMADVSFENALSAYGDSESSLRALLGTFPEKLPIRSVFHNDVAAGSVPVSEALIDVHTDIRARLEAANRAVHQAVVVAVETRDPLAAVTFGTSLKHLQMIAGAGRTKMRELAMTGVPFFTLRLSADVLSSVAGEKADPDALLKMKLAAFY